MTTTAKNMLAEISPLIPGSWNRAEKIQYEIAFERIVNRELEIVASRTAHKTLTDVMNQIAAFEGWKVLIDRAELCAKEGPRPVCEFEIGRVLSEIRRRAERADDDPNPTRAALEECVRAMEQAKERFAAISRWREDADLHDKDMGNPPRTYCEDVEMIEQTAMLACGRLIQKIESARNSLQETEK